MGTMRYKPSDKVRIKSIDWYNRYTNGTEVDCGAYPFTSDMKEFCGQERIIANVCQECYLLLGIDDRFVWTDEMIEGLVEEEVGLVDNLSSRWVNEFNLPKGYIFKDENGNVINTTKIVLEKKKKEYPKTYEECCKVLGHDDRETYCVCHTYANERLFESLYRLKVCRDAYWKIAGEEMGLETPWEPDYTNTNEKKFAIWLDFGEIKLGGAFTTTQMLLSFPTAEMRDAFKENFDPDIKICKEFL